VDKLRRLLEKLPRLLSLEDLSKAIKLEPTPDLLHERGVVNFKLKNFFAAIEDLKGCRSSSCGAYTPGLNDIHALQQLVTIPGLESH
jgi:hypothetical protein